MNLKSVNVKIETGAVEVLFEKVLFDADGNEVPAGNHRDTVIAGQKDKLVDLIGQDRADAIEAQYWTQELIDKVNNIDNI